MKSNVFFSELFSPNNCFNAATALVLPKVFKYQLIFIIRACFSKQFQRI